MPKVILGEMSWIEAKEALGTAKVAIIVTGSTEQHGPHLPVEQDILSSTYVAATAAEMVYSEAVVCTPTSIGTSPFHMGFPGTLSLRYETFINLLLDVCTSLKHHGTKKIIFLNGHGGNGAPLHIATRRAKEELQLDAMWLSYWSLIPRSLCDELLVDKREIPDHSGEFETSIGLFIHPELVNLKAFEDFETQDAKELEKAKKLASYFKLGNNDLSDVAIYNAGMSFNDISNTGIVPIGGNPLNANADKGKRFVEAATKGLANLIKDF